MTSCRVQIELEPHPDWSALEVSFRFPMSIPNLFIWESPLPSGEITELVDWVVENAGLSEKCLAWWGCEVFANLPPAKYSLISCSAQQWSIYPCISPLKLISFWKDTQIYTCMHLFGHKQWRLRSWLMSSSLNRVSDRMRGYRPE